MQYDFTLPANGGSALEIKGKFFKYKSGSGMIRVKTDTGGFVDLLPGQGVWNTDFSRLYISDRSGNNNAGVILAGNFDFHDDRISGDVSIIDGGKNRTISGQTFMLANSSTPPAGTMYFAELWNPAGSGKNVVVEQFSVSSANASNIYCGWHTIRKCTGVNGSGSKKANTISAKSTALSDGTTMAAFPNDCLVLTTTNVQASQTIVLTLKEPIVIPPGLGFYVCNITLGAPLATWVEFFEEPQ